MQAQESSRNLHNNESELNMSSILDGVRSILNELNGQNDGVLLINNAYERIYKNWNKKPSRSRLNWELRVVPLPLPTTKRKGEHNSKAEVPLERAIAHAFNDKNIMCNQMPVASGLLDKPTKESPSEYDKRRAIDLIYKSDALKESYEFIELKVAINKKDSPKNAAIEILEYGLLYLFSREQRNKLKYGIDKKPILRATNIGLRVLAEENYYKNWDDDSFLSMTNQITKALRTFIEGRSQDFSGLDMDFEFQVFTSGYECPAIDTEKELTSEILDSLRNAITTKKNYPRKLI